MPFQSRADLDWAQTVNRNRIRENRSVRDAVRDIRKRESEALGRATSTSERRLIKETALKLKKDATSGSVGDELNFDEVKADKSPEISSGLPAGYVETDVILCQDGSPVNGQILFKAEEEE